LATFLAILPADADEAAAPGAVDLGARSWMVVGPGNNMVLIEYADGAILIDSDLAENARTVSQSIATLTTRPIRYILNTHYHADHAGGNGELIADGGAIVAHENTYRRLRDGLSIEGRMVRAPAPRESLPAATYSERANLRLGEHTLRLIHPGPAHTDGDSIVYLDEANIMHLGDLFFNGGYPFIDIQSGGSVDGYIRAVDLALSIADSDTRIVPGHGALASRVELEQYAVMLKEVRGRVLRLIEAGVSIEEAISRDLLADLNPRWGGLFYPPEAFLRSLYRDLERTRVVRDAP
jgi:glyoxylase-like metal-dependent hydrolase (beta-lactamase superfamily II)